MIKTVIILLLVAMVIALGNGLYHLLKTPDERDKGDRVVKALTWRIGLSVALFAFIILAVQMGWIKPSNSINPINYNQEQSKRIEAEKNE